LDACFEVVDPPCVLLVGQWHLGQIAGDLLDSWTLASARLTVECLMCRCLLFLLAMALIPWKRQKSSR